MLSVSRSSFDQTIVMVEHFVKYAVRTSSKFLEDGSGGAPSIAHALGIECFASAKAAKEETYFISRF